MVYLFEVSGKLVSVFVLVIRSPVLWVPMVHLPFTPFGCPRLPSPAGMSTQDQLLLALPLFTPKPHGTHLSWT